MGLFREQALDAQRDRLHGEVVLLPQVPHILLCLFLLAWLLLVAVFLTQSTYSRKETVQGWLEPDSGLVRVYPQSEGKLAQLLVENGDEVIAGQPLAVINGDRVLQDGEHLEALLLREYQNQKQALERQLKRQANLRQARQTRLANQMRAAEQEMQGIHAQAATQQERIALANKRLQRHMTLADSGHITETELEALRSESLQLESELQSLHIHAAQQQSLVYELSAQLQRLPDETANATDQLQLRLSDLSQDIARLRGARAYVVLAAIEGVISNLDVHKGQRVQLDKPLATILPRDSTLVAHLLVPVRSAGFMQAGQQLQIRYDAFPYQKFGVQTGRLINISDSASLPGEGGGTPYQVQVPVYRARALPETTAIKAYGSSFALKSGMTFSADIRLEQRTLLQWLLEPIYSVRGSLI